MMITSYPQYFYLIPYSGVVLTKQYIIHCFNSVPIYNMQLADLRVQPKSNGITAFKCNFLHMQLQPLALNFQKIVENVLPISSYVAQPQNY